VANKKPTQRALIEALSSENYQLSERLASLELALESANWRLLTMQAEQEFSRDGLRLIVELCRVMFLKNPLVKRAVEVKRLYLWGQGISVKAEDESLQGVLTAFLEDHKNQAELTSHQARMAKEVERQTDGNLFFVFFVNSVTGRVRVRTIPLEEIDTIICNPDDAKDPWYYRRAWTQSRLDVAGGGTEVRTMNAYYPDWRYTPTVRPPMIGGVPVRWETPIYHVKTGGFSNWQFGVPEVYAALDWARAYKEFLEDWASIVRAYRRFAFQLTTPGGKNAIAAAKTKLSSTYGSGGTGAETNPAPVVGSTFITSEGNLTPVKTSGATVSAEDGRRLLLMVAAAVGLPETFFGDVSVGTLATAESLDRPTELLMRDLQTLWADIHQGIFDFVLLQAAKAPQGPLRGLATVQRETDGGEIVETIAWNADINPHIDIDFPPIRSAGTDEQVSAIIKAATLDGKPLAGTLDLPTVTRMLLVALGEDDVEEVMAILFPEGMPAPSTSAGAEGSDDEAGEGVVIPQAEALMVAAVKELRDSLIRLREGAPAAD
jgi:hypothetical protein